MGEAIESKDVKGGVEFVVDESEFVLIEKILRFIRNRRRGSITVNIITHNNKRYSLLEFTDKYKIDLELIDGEEHTNSYEGL